NGDSRHENDRKMTISIKISGPMVDATFLKRLNRFLTIVEIERKRVPCFLPNPGRLQEVLYPGAEVILSRVETPGRKTNYDLIGVRHSGQKISIDSRIPNKLVLEALKKRDIEELSQYTVVEPEYSYGDSRIDFRLSNSDICFLEVKSCTLVEDGLALFPDAPTERGRRHIAELMEAKRRGNRACILFLIQRSDATAFAPNDRTDPAFGDTFREALKHNVEAYAYTSAFVEDRIELRGKRPIQRAA
ncbi:MAG: DNA/RNA nuclease SfsA, partial [Candidatus Geothermarchaeales archaeon]